MFHQRLFKSHSRFGDCFCLAVQSNFLTLLNYPTFAMVLSQQDAAGSSLAA